MARSAKAVKKAQNANPKNTRSQGPLPTPEPTPGVEDARVAAELARKAAEAAANEATDEEPEDPHQEIERIMLCSNDAYAEILAVDPGSSAEDRLAAWRQLGCMLHPKHCELDKAKDAFEKLQKAASEMGVDQPFIDEVNLWDGENDLEAEDDEDDEDDDIDGDAKMDEDVVPVPPFRVMEVYKEATPLLHKLGQDPDSSTLLKQLKDLNDQIVGGNKGDNAKTSNDNERVPDDQWSIPVGFFGPHYKNVLAEYAILKSDPKNAAARRRISVEKALIDELVKQRHFPADWAVLDADDYLKQKNADTTVQEADRKASELESKRIQYPWPTAEAADGSLIVGVRQQGRWGTQVCTEKVEENGQVIRRHESASEVGLLEVEKYKAVDGHKILSDGQSRWSDKDRRDFREVLWVTKSQIQRKNVAANKKDPPADCCVKFHKKGINILTVSSLGKVLGTTSARAQIDKACRRDGIPPPWQAGWVSQYDNPAAVEKDATRRRAMKDAQAKTSSVEHRPTRGRRRSPSVHSYGSASEAEEARDGRVEDLQAQVTDLTKSVNALADMFTLFMKKDATRRRAMKDAQAKTSSVEHRPTRGRRRSPSVHSYGSASEAEEARDGRVEDLQAQVTDLTKSVNALADMFTLFMKTSAAAPPASST